MPRRVLSLPPVRRLGLVGAVLLSFALALTLFTLLPDRRFHSRVATHITPDPDSLGIIPPAAFPRHEGGPSLIPRSIWQIFLKPPETSRPKKDKMANIKDWMKKWETMNPTHDYHLFGDEELVKFVGEHLRDESALHNVLLGTANPAVKSDLLRYLILYFNGGVYTDTDTISLKPIDNWVPEQYRDKARVIVGIEFDRLEGANWRGVHDELQFCQWTVAATPGHRLFTTMLTRAMVFLEELQRPWSLRGLALGLSHNDVLTTTGPSAWTDAVFQELRTMDPTLTSLRDLSGLTEERLIGDILILPIDGFGMGQRHSNSTRNGTIPPMARAKHQFRGTWRDI
jgi:alpha 1,6-mannosyltransferase